MARLDSQEKSQRKRGRPRITFRPSVDLTFVVAVKEELGKDLDKDFDIGTLHDICNAVREVHTKLRGKWYSKKMEQRWINAAVAMPQNTGKVGDET